MGDNETVTRDGFMAEVVGPGPHVVEHGLDSADIIVRVLDLVSFQQVPARITVLDRSRVEVHVGSFQESTWVSAPHQDYIVGVVA